MIRNEDNVLLVRQGRRESPRWMLPGGGVDPGESLTAALARELNEELGCSHVSVAEPCALVESIAPESHASGRHLIHVVFRVDVADPASITTGRSSQDPAVHEIRWVARDELLKLALHPPIGGYLRDYSPGSDFEYFGSLWAP
jgi:8-oxo-dGTP pyrophosphatase MutT (NUDIX family)